MRALVLPAARPAGMRRAAAIVAPAAPTFSSASGAPRARISRIPPLAARLSPQFIIRERPFQRLLQLAE